MPLPVGDCVTPIEVCCPASGLIGAHLLAEAFEAVTQCQDDVCGALTAYQTLGRGDDGHVDAITVTYLGQSTISAPRANGRGIQPQRLLFDVRLRESGWPIVHEEGEAIVLPDPVVQNSLAVIVQGHIEAMYRRLLHLSRHRQLTPSGVRFLGGSVSPLTPLAPLGGVVGGFCTVTVDTV